MVREGDSAKGSTMHKNKIVITHVDEERQLFYKCEVVKTVGSDRLEHLKCRFSKAYNSGLFRKKN